MERKQSKRKAAVEKNCIRTDITQIKAEIAFPPHSSTTNDNSAHTKGKLSPH